METFKAICDAVFYAAKMRFVWCKEPEQEIKNPEVKKAMRYTIQKMLHEQITNQKYSKKG